MKVYVDDMIVKSKTPSTHLTDLAETFQMLKGFNMRLNPSKCVFEVSSIKFLSYIIQQRGVDANPEKIQVIVDMQSPHSINEVQCLTGRLVVLSRFLSRLGDICLSFFQVLKHSKNFE